MTQRENKVTFEDAINRTGFGLYSYLLLSVSGLTVIAMVCTAYGTTVIIPSSACELKTTTSQRGYLASAPILGLILGAVLWGYLSDMFGRRCTLLISLVSAATFNALASLSINWWMLLILQFVATFSCAGQLPQAMTILSESVPMAKRNMSILLVSSIYLLAQGLMAVLAIPIIPLNFSYHLPSLGIYWNSWRTVLLVYSFPSLLSALGLLFMNESPKFLFAKGLQSEAVEVLKKIYRINHLSSKNELEIKGEITVESSSGPKSVSSKNQFVQLFTPPLLKSTIIVTTLFLFQQTATFLVWMATITDQFVQILQTGEGGNLTLCAIIKKSLDTPKEADSSCALNETTLLIVFVSSVGRSLLNLFVSFIINRTGRRNMVMFVTVFCGLCGVAVNLVPNAIASGMLYLTFLVGIICHGLYTAIAVALFPTSLRTLAVAFVLTGNRIGSAISVQILNFLFEVNCEAGFYTYAAIFTMSSVVASFLVDDRKIERENAKKTVV